MALDNFRTIELIWDKANKSIIKTIKTASSDTTGRYLSVKILDGGQEVTLNNAKLQLYWEHPNFNTSGTDDFNTINNGGLFKMTFSKEMLTNVGELNAHLVLNLSDGKITSDGFKIEVIKGANDGVVVPTNGKGLVEQIDGKIEKGNVTLGDLTQEVKLAMTGGSVAVVGVDAVGTENIKDAAVLTKNTDFFTQGKNLFDKNDVEDNKRVSGSAGSVITVQGVSTSGHIRVIGGKNIHRNVTDAYAVFAQDGQVLLGGTSASTNKVINLPEGAYTIRVSVPTSSLDVFQLEYGGSFTGYERFKGVLSDDISVSEKNLPQINPEKTSFFEEKADGKNLFNISRVLKGKQLKSDGTLADSFAGNYDTTHIIGVEPNSYITISRSEGILYIVRCLLFFDKNNRPLLDTFIENIGEKLLSYTINVPENANYVQISYASSSNNVQVEQGGTATSYEPFEGQLKLASQFLPNTTTGLDVDLRSINNHWFGKKVVWNGDSITDGYAANPPYFRDIVSNNLGMASVNYAIGGSMIGVDESDPQKRNPIVLRYDEMDNDADLIIIAGGTNDNGVVPLGTFDDRTNYTFYGAVHNLCLGLINKYVDKQILFMTPIKRYDGARDEQLRAIADAIIKVCGHYGIPVLDAYREISLNMDIPSQYDALFADDGGHPNQAGHEVMARRITGYLKQLA